MERVALYRKYRSKSFEDLSGQASIISALSGAVEHDKIGHAYLFAGPRGTGKTSVARIFARMVNQLDLETDLEKLVDISEIDAASNRGIDEIRLLKEKVKLQPTRLKYKVYIIDEVHMLTKEAFNALLKTLEEPPSYAIFILATTEIHKLPETIISRTQRFDFQPIGTELIEQRLIWIAEQEKIEISSQATQYIAKLSRGGMRDAIGVLDQLSGFGQAIDLEFLLDFYGFIKPSDLEKLTSLIIEGDFSAIQFLAQLTQKGADARQLNAQLIEYLREQLYIKSDYRLIKLLDLFVQAEMDFKLIDHPSLALEMAIWRYLQQSLDPTVKTNSFVVDTSAKNPPITKPKIEKKPEQSPEPTSRVMPRISQDFDPIRLADLLAIKYNSLAAIIKQSRLRLDGQKLIIQTKFKFYHQQLEDREKQKIILDSLAQIGHQADLIEVVLAVGSSQEEATLESDHGQDIFSIAKEIFSLEGTS
ncbi:DNA polymerase III subunit gamma/tau [Candidatus Saccharibacteria bacterium]|nr:DNA polymerase III subunit gamma/tau [Candidatus Saccharibacteria bacterium]MCB9834799.1 DNA polymerase III subunit gamma/tau [Candidatus Nomurabacteria bacterium]